MEYESSTKEVLIVSDSLNKESNCTMYDIDNFSVIETYKEGHSMRNGLHLIGYDYLLSAFADRPRLKIWQVGHPNTVNFRMNPPGIVSALAVSRNGLYCVAGIGTVIHVWEVATGNLDSRIECHMQNITCIKFTSDDSHFITAGRDGYVFVFSLTKAIEPRESNLETPESRWAWGDHSAEVTDIHVGSMGIYGRVATASKDHTCRIYELDSGFNLHIIKLSAPLTAVTMDLCENFLYLGSRKGDIYRINLFKTQEVEINFDGTETKDLIQGHTKEITSLIVSRSGKYLISGSADHKCIVWNIKTLSIANKHHFQGIITNIISTEVPPSIKDDKYTPRIFVAEFKKDSKNRQDSTPVNIIDRDLSLFHAGTPDQFFDSSVLNWSLADMEKRMLLRSTTAIEEMSRVNNAIFSFALANQFDRSCDDEAGSSSSK